MSYTFQAWGKRNGASRIYINSVDGLISHGYIDLATGSLDGDIEEVRRGAELLTQWMADRFLDQSTSSAPKAEDFMDDDGPDDLAGNVPGAAIENMTGNSYKIGLLGEQRTALELMPLLSQGWKVLHAIPLTDRKDIDHLLVGPAGVFAVNTKVTDYPVEYRDPSVYVGGHRKDWRESQLHATNQAELRLKEATGMDVVVHSLVVVWSPIHPKGADWIIAGEYLREFLNSLPRVQSPERIEYVFSCARQRAAWQ